jgi:DNA (cytosine-5)-methyltransferase 1
MSKTAGKRVRIKRVGTNGGNKTTSRRSNFVALSFFTGAMGLDLGLEKAGIHPILASEIDAAAIQTIKLNRPNLNIIEDFRDYTPQEIRKHAGLTAKTDIDLIFGGPPCQAFSTAGKRKAFEDERGNVFLRFIELILALRPRYAVIENVRGLLSAPLLHRPHSNRGFGFDPLGAKEQEGGALSFVLEQLRDAHYGVSFNLYNSANFGSPQIRERVVVVCSRDGKKLPYLVPTHSNDPRSGLKPWRTVRDALEGLPDAPCDHVKFPEKRLKYYRQLKEGQNWRNLPSEIQQEALGRSFFAGGGKTGFLRRLAWDKPSPTLVTHPAMPATDLAHPEEDRPLSIQEYKRIQEFPNSWKIWGSMTDQYRQIGNAVPTSLGKAVGKLLLTYDSGRAIQVFPGFAYSRYVRTDEQSWENDYARKQSVFSQKKFAFG